MPVPHLYGRVDVNASFLVHLQMVLGAVLVHHHHHHCVDVGIGVSKLQPTYMDDDFVGPRSVDQENKKMLEGVPSKCKARSLWRHCFRIKAMFCLYEGFTKLFQEYLS